MKSIHVMTKPELVREARRLHLGTTAALNAKLKADLIRLIQKSR